MPLNEGENILKPCLKQASITLLFCYISQCNPSYILEFIHACIQLVQTLISTFLCDITILQLDNPKPVFIMPPPRGIKQWCCLTSVAYIRPKSRTERPRKTKIGTEVAHVTRDSDTTFKVKRSKVNLLLMSQIANIPEWVPPDEIIRSYCQLAGLGRGIFCRPPAQIVIIGVHYPNNPGF